MKRIKCESVIISDTSKEILFAMSSQNVNPEKATKIWSPSLSLSKYLVIETIAICRTLPSMKNKKIKTNQVYKSLYKRQKKQKW